MSNGAHSSLIGRTLGNRYVIDRVLGTGSMGTVYRARQIELGTVVAVKVLHPRLLSDPGVVQRFEREAFATSRLDHPNALRVLDFGRDDDLLYLVTEYVEAGDLLSVMEAEWPLDDARIVEILSQVLGALIAVHDIGIVHRDLKPENILVLADKSDDGSPVDVVKVCDFGIAKVTRPTSRSPRDFTPRLTEEGIVVGTPDYMSPEQAQGTMVDGRSDLYSVGVVLYHLLAGRTPFTAETPVGIALQHVSEIPVPPSQYRNVHPGLEAVCLRAMSKRPEDRFQTAREMRKALRDAWASSSTALAVSAPPPAVLQVGSTFSTSRPAVLSVHEEIARHRLRETQRRRRRWVVAYAAVASVTVPASAFFAGRTSTATDPIDRAYQFPASDAKEPSTGARAESAPAATTNVDEVHSSTVFTTEEREPSIVLSSTAAKAEAQGARPPIEARLNPRARPRQQPSPNSSGQRAVVTLAPPSQPVVPAPSSDALLIRSEPWENRTSPSEPTPSVAVKPPAPQRREDAPRETSEPRANETSEPRAKTSDTKATAPVVAPAAPSRPAGPAASIDVDRAAVNIANVATSAGISGAKVKVGLSHVPLAACYREALRSRPSESRLDADLRLTIDVGGRVIGATLSRDGGFPGLRSCIEETARSAVIRGVDTGDGTATVQVSFVPR